MGYCEGCPFSLLCSLKGPYLGVEPAAVDPERNDGLIFPEQGGKIPRRVNFKQHSVLCKPGKKQALSLVTTDSCLIDLGMVQGYPGLILEGEVRHKNSQNYEGGCHLVQALWPYLYLVPGVQEHHITWVQVILGEVCDLSDNELASLIGTFK